VLISVPPDHYYRTVSLLFHHMCNKSHCVRGLTAASIVYVTVNGSELLLWNTSPLPANSNVPDAIGTSPVIIVLSTNPVRCE
jgi:hypothetical protein